MVLNEMKTNTQKGDIKDKPQTNDIYKIRQVIIKITEYTHTHTRTHIYTHIPISKIKTIQLK